MVGIGWKERICSWQSYDQESWQGEHNCPIAYWHPSWETRRGMFYLSWYSPACLPCTCPLLPSPPLPGTAKFSAALGMLGVLQHCTCAVPPFPLPPLLHWNICPEAFLSSSGLVNLIPLWESDYILTQVNASLSTEFQALEICLCLWTLLKLYPKIFT